MISMTETQYRAKNGPIMDENGFVKKYQLKLRELAKKSGVILKLDELIPAPEVGDAIYQAAFELALDIGLYHLDTHRVIKFTEDELRRTASTRKGDFTLGEGKDQVTIRTRHIEDDRWPVRIVGPAGNPLTEEFYVPIMASYAKLPEAQGLVPGVLVGARGLENESGTPGELICAMREAEMIQEATRMAGKPGMLIGEAPMSALSVQAAIAAYNPNGYRKTTSMIPMQVFPDLKVNWEILTRIAWALESGVETWSTAFTIMEAFARDTLESAISTIAGYLMFLCITQANILYGGSITSRRVWNHRKMVQDQALKNLALSRNVGIPHASISVGAAGPCTKMVLYENAVETFGAAAAGGSVATFGKSSSGARTNCCSGMEGRMLCEAAIAAAGIPRTEANQILNRAIALFENDSPNPPPGKSFPECYDPVKIEPTDEYKRIYEEAKKDLRNAGMPFKY